MKSSNRQTLGESSPTDSLSNSHNSPLPLNPTILKRRQLAEKLAIKEKEKIEREKKRNEIMKQKNLSEKTKIWTEEILPNWKDYVGTTRLRELCYRGIPSHLRGRVWPLLISNETEVTEELYESLCMEALVLFHDKMSANRRSTVNSPIRAKTPKKERRRKAKEAIETPQEATQSEESNEPTENDSNQPDISSLNLSSPISSLPTLSALSPSSPSSPSSASSILPPPSSSSSLLSPPSSPSSSSPPSTPPSLSSLPPTSTLLPPPPPSLSTLSINSQECIKKFSLNHLNETILSTEEILTLDSPKREEISKNLLLFSPISSNSLSSQPNYREKHSNSFLVHSGLLVDKPEFSFPLSTSSTTSSSSVSPINSHPTTLNLLKKRISSENMTDNHGKIRNLHGKKQDSSLSSRNSSRSSVSSRNSSSSVSNISLNPTLEKIFNTVSLIQWDLPRTYPTLGFFHDGGLIHVGLERILLCYSLYCPEIGYVQGMSFLVGNLLLYMSEYSSFQLFINLLNKTLLQNFYSLKKSAIDAYVLCFNHFFKKILPFLYKYMREEDISSEMFLIDWNLSLFTKALPLEIAAYIWDIYFLEGEIILLIVSLSLLKLYGSYISTLKMEDILSFLLHLPEGIDQDELIRNILSIKLLIPRKLYNKIRQEKINEINKKNEYFNENFNRNSISSPSSMISSFSTSNSSFLVNNSCSLCHGESVKCLCQENSEDKRKKNHSVVSVSGATIVSTAATFSSSSPSNFSLNSPVNTSSSGGYATALSPPDSSLSSSLSSAVSSPVSSSVSSSPVSLQNQTKKKKSSSESSCMPS